MVTTVTTTTTTISTTTTTEVKKDVEKPVETSIKAEVDKMMAEEDSRLRMTRRTAVAIDQGNLYFKLGQESGFKTYINQVSLYSSCNCEVGGLNFLSIYYEVPMGANRKHRVRHTLVVARYFPIHWIKPENWPLW